MPENRTSATARFNAAFTWFDHERWAWHYAPEPEGGSAYRIPGARRDAFGEIAIYMPGATADQFDAVHRWLIVEFNPAYKVPATRYVDAELIGQRAGGHNSDMPRPGG